MEVLVKTPAEAIVMRAAQRQCPALHKLSEVMTIILLPNHVAASQVLSITHIGSRAILGLREKLSSAEICPDFD